MINKVKERKQNKKKKHEKNEVVALVRLGRPMLRSTKRKQSAF